MHLSPRDSLHRKRTGGSDPSWPNATILTLSASGSLSVGSKGSTSAESSFLFLNLDQQEKVCVEPFLGQRNSGIRKGLLLVFILSFSSQRSSLLPFVSVFCVVCRKKHLPQGKNVGPGAEARGFTRPHGRVRSQLSPDWHLRRQTLLRVRCGKP